MLSCHSLSPWFRKSTPKILLGLSNWAPNELATDAKFRLFPNNPWINKTGGSALLVCLWKSVHFNGTVAVGEPNVCSIVVGDRSCSINAEHVGDVVASSKQAIAIATLESPWYNVDLFDGCCCLLFNRLRLGKVIMNLCSSSSPKSGSAEAKSLKLNSQSIAAWCSWQDEMVEKSMWCLFDPTKQRQTQRGRMPRKNDKT